MNCILYSFIIYNEDSFWLTLIHWVSRSLTMSLCHHMWENERYNMALWRGQLARGWRCVCWCHAGLYVIWLTSIKCFRHPRGERPHSGQEKELCYCPCLINKWAECLIYDSGKVSNLECFPMLPPGMQPGILPNLLLLQSDRKEQLFKSADTII